MANYPLAGFAALTASMAADIERAMQKSLEEAGKIVENEAKRVIGTYDYNWKPLASSTLARKSADTPLLETGEMRESINHTVQGHIAYVGSDNDKALYHELGTSRIPARPFLRGALDEKVEEIVEATGRRVHGKLISR